MTERLVLSGLALAAVSLAVIVAADLVGQAYASADAEKAYLVAVSSGPALSLVHAGNPATPSSMSRQLTCSKLVAVGEVRLGLHCQQHVKGGL